MFDKVLHALLTTQKLYFPHKIYLVYLNNIYIYVITVIYKRFSKNSNIFCESNMGSVRKTNIKSAKKLHKLGISKFPNPGYRPLASVSMLFCIE